MSVFSKTIDYLSGVLKLRRELEELKQLKQKVSTQ